MTRPKLLIFDLDGTLIDSHRDLIECVNATLLHCNLSALPADRISSFIGDGAAALVERSLQAATGDTGYRHDEALEYFLSFYRKHLLDHTRAYPGVLAAVSTLHATPNAPLMAVLTNKPVNPSRQICDALGITPYLFANYGGNSFATKKPNPEGLVSIWREASDKLERDLTAREVIMVGDSDVDARTARRAGVRIWGCTWGFATAKLLAETPDALAHAPEDWLSLYEATAMEESAQPNEFSRMS